MASLMVWVPWSLLLQQWSVVPAMVILELQLKVSVVVMALSSMAEEAVMSLKVEPGS